MGVSSILINVIYITMTIAKGILQEEKSMVQSSVELKTAFKI